MIGDENGNCKMSARSRDIRDMLQVINTKGSRKGYALGVERVKPDPTQNDIRTLLTLSGLRDNSIQTVNQSIIILVLILILILLVLLIFFVLPFRP